MWWHETIAAIGRERGWPDGDVWHIDGGPRFGLFGARRMAVEVRDGSPGALRGSFLFDAARRELVAARVSPRRFVPVWRLKQWLWTLAGLPLRLAGLWVCSILSRVLRRSERIMAWSLRQLRVSRGERARLLAGLPDDVRQRVIRRTRPGGGAPGT